MKTVAVIQVRLGSQRLPGKALMKIGDRTVLEWVVHRTRMVEGLDEVAIATSTRTDDNAITRVCRQFEVVGFRGSADDVLDRFYRCADRLKATHILRVTADCPLLDPGINSRIVDALKTSSASYVSMSTRSNGLVQEAFSMGALTRAWERATEPYDREHVVPWMIRTEKTRFLKPDFDLGAGRWCVDTREDLGRLRALHLLEPDLFELSATELVQLREGVTA